MTSACLLSHSLSGPTLSPYRLHDQFYEAMFPQEIDNDKDEDSFLGARMQFPPALVQQKSSRSAAPRPLSSAKSESDLQPRARRRTSLGDSSRRSVSTAKTIKTRPSRHRSQRMSRDEMQIQQLHLEARRHQAVTARVTKLEDFRTMSVTLPAAKTSSAAPSSPLKLCPLIPSAEQCTKSKQPQPQRRKAGPMFRGRRSWTSSAAAGSFVAEATQADRYYCPKGNNSNNSPNMPRKAHSERRMETIWLEPKLGQIHEEPENEEEDKNKLRWKSLLPKKWISTPRSLAVEI